MSELLWGKVGKYLAGLTAFLLAELLVFGWGDHHGRAIIQARWDAQAAVMAKALAEAQEKSATISERVVTKYVDRVQVVQGQTQTIIKRIPYEVSAKSDARCVIPMGFVRVLDAAAEGTSDLPATAASVDDAPSPVALSAVAASVADNYGNVCRANAEQLSALQDWVRQLHSIDITKKPSQ